MILLQSPDVPYEVPWEWSYHERLRHLSSGELRVAYFYRAPDCSTFRYRVYNMIQALNSLDESIGASYFQITDLDRYGIDFLNKTDILVLCRALYCPKIDHLITCARAKGIKIVFDVDDLIFDSSYTHLILNTLDQTTTDADLDHWFGRISRCGRTLQMCDHAIVTNDFLAEKVRRFTGKPVFVVPNFLNKEQMAVSSAFYSEKVGGSGFGQDGKIHVGYFSGTPTHNKDFGLVVDSLIRLLNDDKRVVVRVAGYMQMSDRFRGLEDRIDVVPFQNFVGLQRAIAETEVNLVPLQDNTFTNCKSELKYFEAAIAGTVTIASPTFTFKNAIQDGVNSCLSNSQQWYEKITTLINDRNLYSRLAVAGQAHAEATYAWYKQGEIILQALQINQGVPEPAL